MNQLSTERKGEASLFLGAIIWSFFPIITLLSYAGLEPITSLAWSTLISFILFTSLSVIRKSWVNIFKKEILLPILGVAAIHGILVYFLFFIGLQYTTAGNAAVVSTLEILFSYLFFHVFRKEHIDFSHRVGIILMSLSALVILSPNFESLQKGDLLILLAMAISPLGNLFQKRLRSKISTEQILFYRALIASFFLFGAAYLFGEKVVIPTLDIWPILIISGILLFGLQKILWVEGIHRVGVTKAVSITSISPIFTLIFAYFILGDVPTTIQLISVPLAVIGILFLTRNNA